MITTETRERIKSRIKDDSIQQLIAETDFYFELGTKAVENWKAATSATPDFFDDLSKMEYGEIKEKAQTLPEVLNSLNLMNTIVSYSDLNASEKSAYNQYPDKRVIAKAGIRQNNWIKHLLIYKINEDSPAQSIKNALNYLLDPINNVPIISEDHKRLVSEQVIGKPYSLDTFTNDLIEFFQPFELKPKSEKNLTYIITRLLYYIDDVWCEAVTGLIARDSFSEWKDELLNEMQDSNCGVIWWHKKPSNPKEVIASFKKKIENGLFFDFYYVSNNMATYRARVVDFVEYENYNSKVDEWKALNPHWFEEDVAKYEDGKQSARIIFLIDQFEKLEVPIPIDEFVMYKNAAKPNVVNLVAYSRINNEPTTDLIATKPIINIQSMKYPLNQILFGPPGTGKTYNTINKALEIIGVNIAGKDRRTIKSLFEQKMKNGQIVFTTFHQSMCYEDFIEGIKPLKPNASNILQYNIQNGIFKNLCVAKIEVVDENFDWFYNQLLEALENEKIETLKTKEGYPFIVSKNTSDGLTISSGKNIPTGESSTSITKAKLKENNSYDKNSSYIIPIREYMKSNFQPPVVLIIDEINRGNVSQIFGELITLIEEDKRLGKSEELKVKLPYSKSDFGVPPNLFIIGTMNTADRSVEALDVALRRRFSFVEMPPKYDLIELDKEIAGYKLSLILKTLNRRIVKLLDKDHQIGHAYFFNVKDSKALYDAFCKNIIPLLQEYFFGDYGKIGLVLGKGFIEKENDGSVFADFGYDDIANLEDRDLYKIRSNNIADGVAEFESAIEQLMADRKK